MFRMTLRDQQIVGATSTKVRLFSQRQIANRWFGGDLSNVRRRMNQLIEADLMHRVLVRARPLPCLDSPLITWRPGDDEPEFGRASYKCRQRWRNRPLRRCAAYIATTRGAQMFGGRARGELRHELQVTHDLGVAHIWLYLHEHASPWADAWRGEDIMAHSRLGEKLPDAFIVNGEGVVLWVLEFGGAYDEPRIREFHQDCQARQLPYQMW